MANTKKRVLWVDLLRITATWGVISLHGKSCYEFDIGSLKWGEFTFIGYAFMFCVPVFLMLSGYLSLQKEISIQETLTKRVPRVLLMKILSLIFCAVTGICLALFQHQEMLGSINYVRTWAYGTSYLAVLAGCYLVSPFLCLFIQKIEYERYFLVLSFIFCIAVPTVCDLEYVKWSLPRWIGEMMEWIDYGEVFLPVGSVFIFVLGHYLGRISQYISKKFAVGFFIFSFLLAQFCNFYATIHGNSISSILQYGRYYGGYVSPLLLLYSSSIFLLFKVVLGDVHIPDTAGTLIRHIGRSATLVFLLHGIVINLIRPYIPVFWAGSFIVETVVNTSFYFVVALLISLVLERVPGIRKII